MTELEEALTAGLIIVAAIGLAVLFDIVIHAIARRMDNERAND